MDKLEQLRQKLADLKTDGRKLVESAESANRDLTDDEVAKAEGIRSQIADTEKEIKAEERRRELARSFSGDVQGQSARPAAQPVNRAEEAMGGFRNAADFARAVQFASRPGGHVDNRLAQLYRPGAAPSNYHQESGSTAGEGYLVPPAMRQSIWSIVLGQSDLLALTNPEPTAARQVSRVQDETTPWGSSGIQANWRAEGSQMSASKLALKGANVELHELYAFVTATEELLEDAPLLQSRIEQGAGRAISWKASDAIMWGNGVGMPLGFMEAACLVTVAKESGQTADTIVAANVLKMLSRLLMTPGARPLWIINSQAIPQLATMTIGNQPMFIPQGGITDQLRATLLGYPILFTEHAKALGDLGDISLVDMQGYGAYTRSADPAFASSMHLFFDYGIQAFRWMFRVGGSPYLSAAVAGAKSGSDTKSHFVALAARA